MKMRIKRVHAGDEVVRSLSNWSAVIAKAPEDGVLITMGLSKGLYLPLSKLVELVDMSDVDEFQEFDPWEVDASEEG